MNKRKLLFIGTLIIVGIISLILYNIFSVSESVSIDKSRYPVNGIDVSKFTGKINFKKLKNEYPGTIDFLYIKATEGATLVDRNFEVNYRNARKNGLKVGAYHFFRFNRPGKDQAANFLKQIKGKRMDLPLVLDVEEWGNSKNSNRDRVVKEIGVFLSIVEKKTNSKIIFYSNESSYRKFIEGNYENHIWICSFSKKPKIRKKWLLWQYSHTARLPGAEGLIDLNTFNGSKEEWENFIKNKQVYYK